MLIPLPFAGGDSTYLPLNYINSVKYYTFWLQIKNQ